MPLPREATDRIAELLAEFLTVEQSLEILSRIEQGPPAFTDSIRETSVKRRESLRARLAPPASA